MIKAAGTVCFAHNEVLIIGQPGLKKCPAITPEAFLVQGDFVPTHRKGYPFVTRADEIAHRIIGCSFVINANGVDCIIINTAG